MAYVTNLSLPIVSPDTSVLNRLLKDKAEKSEPVFLALKTDYHVRLIGPNVEEIMATTKQDIRHQLFGVARRLLKYGGDADCIYPHGELLKRLIRAYMNDPANFVWHNIQMIFPEYEDGLSALDVISDDALAAEQKQSANESKIAFEPVWEKLKPELAAELQRLGRKPPMTYKEAIQLYGEEGGLVWNLGKQLYDRPFGANISEKDIRHFMDVCPPFRAIVYGFLVLWYENALRDENGQRLTAGRNDLFMAAQLPYCHQFITNDKEQRKALSEVVEVAGLSTKIVPYNAFCESLMETTSNG